MNSTLVDTILPQAPPQQPKPSRQKPVEQDDSFDRCLQSASGKKEVEAPQPKPKDKDTESPDASDAKPADEPKETAESGQADKQEPHDEEMAALAAVEELLAVLPEQKTVEVPINFETPEEETVTIPVQVVEPSAKGAAPAREGLPGQKVAEAPELATAPKPEQPAPQAAAPEAEQADPGPLTEVKPETSQAQRPDEHAAEHLEARIERREVRQAEARHAAADPRPAPAQPAHAGPAPAEDADGSVTLAAPTQVETRSAEAPAQAAAPRATTGPLQVEDSRVIGQIVRGASIMTSQGRTEVRVRLRPPELGTVHVELSSDRTNVLEARIVAEREEVRELIERNLPELRQALQGAGVHVGDFDVSTQDSGQAPGRQAAQPGGRGGFSLDVEPELEAEPLRTAAVRGVNRSAAADTIDYII